MAKDEVTPRRLDRDADKRMGALARSVLRGGKKKATPQPTPKRGQQGSTARGIVFVTVLIGLFLFGLVNAGHHPDMRVVAAAAIVGALALLMASSFGRYREHNQADKASTEAIEKRILPSTSTDHFLDGV